MCVCGAKVRRSELVVRPDRLVVHDRFRHIDDSPPRMFRARGVNPVAWPLLVITHLPRLPAETKQPPDGQEVVVDETTLGLVEHYSAENCRALGERFDTSP